MSEEEQKQLVRSVRQIAREEAHGVLDEHLDDYDHKEKSAENDEVE